jgi:hypothetical protein
MDEIRLKEFTMQHLQQSWFCEGEDGINRSLGARSLILAAEV